MILHWTGTSAQAWDVWIEWQLQPGGHRRRKKKESKGSLIWKLIESLWNVSNGYDVIISHISHIYIIIIINYYYYDDDNDK